MIGGGSDSAASIRYRSPIKEMDQQVAHAAPGAPDARTNRPRTQNDKSTAREFLRQIQPFSQIPEETLSELVERSDIAITLPGEYLAFEGDENPASFIVMSGRVALTKTSANGKDLVVQLLGPRELYGLVMALVGSPARYSACTQAKSEILQIPVAVLSGVLEDHPKLYRGIVEHLSVTLRSSYNLALALAHDRVEVRIANLLLHLGDRFFAQLGEASERGPVIIDITRQQIADLTGTTPETATRVIRALHRKGIIECVRPGVITLKSPEMLHLLAAQ